MTIHAYTELTSPLPAYINVSERVSDPRDVIVTVRSSGENTSSTIILSRDELRKLADAIYKYTAPQATQPVDGVIDDAISPSYKWLSEVARTDIAEVRNAALMLMAYHQGTEFHEPAPAVAEGDTWDAALTLRVANENMNGFKGKLGSAEHFAVATEYQVAVHNLVKSALRTAPAKPTVDLAAAIEALPLPTQRFLDKGVHYFYTYNDLIAFRTAAAALVRVQKRVM
jgi:hypothetical protein